MTTSAHPSPEALSAYFDKETLPAEQAAIEAHISQCTQCSNELEWFQVMAELGPRVEESLPGDTYWSDLPDRVLQRVLLAYGAPQVPRESAVAGGFWQRWLGRRPVWRAALVSVATVAVASAVWLTVERTPHPWAPPADSMIGATSTMLPQEAAVTAALPLPEDLQSSTSPSSQTAAGFAQRVFLTYGNRNNMGTSLDLNPGQVMPDAGQSGVGSQVTQAALLNKDMRALADEVLAYGCGEDSLEQAWMAALRSEQVGDYRTAALGYQLLMHRVGPDHRLFPYVDFRLNYLVWKSRMAAGMATEAQALAELNRLAERYYQTWEASGRNTDCRKAWCMTRVLQQIGPELQGPIPTQLTSSRIEELKNCMQ